MSRGEPSVRPLLFRALVSTHVSWERTSLTSKSRHIQPPTGAAGPRSGGGVSTFKLCLRFATAALAKGVFVWRLNTAGRGVAVDRRRQ